MQREGGEVKDNYPWTKRVEEIQKDPMKNDLGALLYYLVESSIKSPVTHKRTSPEESLWCEAHMLLTHLQKEKNDANS